MNELFPEFIEMHRQFADIGRVISVAMLVWLGFMFWQQLPPRTAFYRVIFLFEILILMQVMVGFYFMLGLRLRPVELVLHLLYATLITITFPVIFLYTRNETDPRRITPVWMYGFIFMFGALSRAVLTGAIG